jgi:hypothetical protein
MKRDITSFSPHVASRHVIPATITSRARCIDLFPIPRLEQNVSTTDLFLPNPGDCHDSPSYAGISTPIQRSLRISFSPRQYAEGEHSCQAVGGGETSAAVDPIDMARRRDNE